MIPQFTLSKRYAPAPIYAFSKTKLFCGFTRSGKCSGLFSFSSRSRCLLTICWLYCYFDVLTQDPSRVVWEGPRRIPNPLTKIICPVEKTKLGIGIAYYSPLLLLDCYWTAIGLLLASLEQEWTQAWMNKQASAATALQIHFSNISSRSNNRQ